MPAKEDKIHVAKCRYYLGRKFLSYSKLFRLFYKWKSGNQPEYYTKKPSSYFNYNFQIKIKRQWKWMLIFWAKYEIAAFNYISIFHIISYLEYIEHENNSCAKSDLLFLYYLSMQRSIKSLQDALNDIQLFFL